MIIFTKLDGCSSAVGREEKRRPQKISLSPECY
uniref:Uncharacterized protein n=1 Tax=Romanomermis culicivorax TaxID=13658 RepID=A0A915ILV9_ROMCU